MEKKPTYEFIPFDYDYTYEVSEGLVAVCRYSLGEKSLWGFADATGKEVIPRKYDDVYSFSEGLAAVCVKTLKWKEKWGFIDRAGNEVIPCKYDIVRSFYEDRAIVGIGERELDFDGGGLFVFNGKWCCIDRKGNEVIPVGKYKLIGKYRSRYDTREFTQDEDDNWLSGVDDRRYIKGIIPFCDWETDKFGFLDKDGSVVVQAKYGLISPFSEEGFAKVYIGDRSGGEWTYINKEGEEIIPNKHDSDKVDRNGRKAIGLKHYEKSIRKWGLRDKEGNEVIPCKYDYIRGFKNGFSAVMFDEKWGFIDTEGNEVVPCIYREANDFSEGMAAVTLVDNDKFFKRGQRGFIRLLI